MNFKLVYLPLEAKIKQNSEEIRCVFLNFFGQEIFGYTFLCMPSVFKHKFNVTSACVDVIRHTYSVSHMDGMNFKVL